MASTNDEKGELGRRGRRKGGREGHAVDRRSCRRGIYKRKREGRWAKGRRKDGSLVRGCMHIRKSKLFMSRKMEVKISPRKV